MVAAGVSCVGDGHGGASEEGERVGADVGEEEGGGGRVEMGLVRDGKAEVCGAHRRCRASLRLRGMPAIGMLFGFGYSVRKRFLNQINQNQIMLF